MNQRSSSINVLILSLGLIVTVSLGFVGANYNLGNYAKIANTFVTVIEQQEVILEEKIFIEEIDKKGKLFEKELIKGKAEIKVGQPQAHEPKGEEIDVEEEFIEDEEFGDKEEPSGILGLLEKTDDKLNKEISKRNDIPGEAEKIVDKKLKKAESVVGSAKAVADKVIGSKIDKAEKLVGKKIEKAEKLVGKKIDKAEKLADKKLEKLDKLDKKFEKKEIEIDKKKKIKGGIYVATGDKYYALISPKLEALGWKSISVNGNEAYIVKSGKKVLSVNLDKLDKSTKEILNDITFSFTKSLKEVVLNNPFIPNAYSYTKSPYSDSGSYGTNSYNNHPDQSVYKQSSYGPSSGYKSPVAPSYKSSSYKSPGYKSDKVIPYSARNYYPPMFCSKINYQNLGRSKLNKTLDGDLYYLDLFGNALDIFSTTVSAFCKDGLSIIYRDENFFAYSRQELPASINRIILVGTNAILIFKDGTVLAKPSWALDATEFNLVLRARSEVQDLIRIRDRNVSGEEVFEAQVEKIEDALETSKLDKSDKDSETLITEIIKDKKKKKIL